MHQRTVVDSARSRGSLFCWLGLGRDSQRPGSATRQTGWGQIPFDVQAFRKYCLLNGFDDIGLTLRHRDEIKAFEAQRLATKPWLAHTMLPGA